MLNSMMVKLQLNITKITFMTQLYYIICFAFVKSFFDFYSFQKSVQNNINDFDRFIPTSLSKVKTKQGIIYFRTTTRITCRLEYTFTLPQGSCRLLVEPSMSPDRVWLLIIHCYTII